MKREIAAFAAVMLPVTGALAQVRPNIPYELNLRGPDPTARPRGAPPLMDGACCYACGTETWINAQRSWTIEMDLGGYVIVKAFGTVACAATASYDLLIQGCCGCIPPPLCQLDPEHEFDSEADTDSGDLLAQAISAAASASVPFASGSVSASVSQGGTVVNYSQSNSSYFRAFVLKDLISCDPTGALSIQSVGNGIGVIVRNYVFKQVGPEPMSYTRTIHYSLEVLGVYWPDCCNTSPPCPQCVGGLGAAEVQQVHFLSDIVTVGYASGPDTVDVVQGVYAVLSDGSVIRLGVCTDKAYDPQATKSGFEVDADEPYPVTFASGATAETMDIEQVDDAFTRFDGDLDRDGQVCWIDRELLRDLRGVSIGEIGYHARADANLDGDIDGDDVVGLNGIKCSADVNCDGQYTVADFGGYQTEFTQGDMAADMNGDGNLTIADFGAFQTVISLGCP